MKARSLATPQRLLGFGRRKPRPRPRFCWPATRACQPEILRLVRRRPEARSKGPQEGQSQVPRRQQLHFDKARGIYTHSRKGLEICKLFQKQGTGSLRPSARSAWDRTLWGQGVSPHFSDTRESTFYMHKIVFGKPFLLYHRSGHSPQPCKELTQSHSWTRRIYVAGQDLHHSQGQACSPLPRGGAMNADASA